MFEEENGLSKTLVGIVVILLIAILSFGIAVLSNPNIVIGG